MNKMLCIHVKVLDSDFELQSKMLIHFLLWVFIGQKCETRSIFTSRQKSAQILGQTKKLYMLK